MIRIIKYELDKIIKDKTFLVISIISLIIISGILLINYEYSQLTSAEEFNKDKGYVDFYSETVDLYSGDFNDQKVGIILSDYMDRLQSNTKNNNLIDVFTWPIANVFLPESLPTGGNTYTKMSESIESGNKITIEQLNISTIKEVGFANSNNPLKLGSYVTWGDLFKTTNSLFLLASLFIIFICSSVFSNETSNNINQLIFSTKYGRGKLTIAKICAATSLSIIVFTIITLISFIFFYQYYGMNGWDASIQTNFTFRLFDFPVEMNNLQVYLLVIGVQLAGLISITGITLLISSITRTPFISLSTSLGAFILPFLLGKIFQSGIIIKILNLFPIQYFQVEEMLSIMKTNIVFFFYDFSSNIVLTISIAIIIKIVMDLAIYFKIKYSQV